MLKFRPLKVEDLPLRLKWLNDPEVFRFLGNVMRQGTDLKFHQEWFDEYVKDDKQKIFLISSGDKPIGQVGLLDVNDGDKNAELYIVIGEEDFRGKGLGKEVLKFISDYAFNDLKLHRIQCHVHADNVRAVKLYEKFGFIREGLLKENIFHNGKYTDELVMALLNH